MHYRSKLQREGTATGSSATTEHREQALKTTNGSARDPGTTFKRNDEEDQRPNSDNLGSILASTSSDAKYMSPADSALSVPYYFHFDHIPMHPSQYVPTHI